RSQQLQDVVILADDGVEEQLHFATHRLTEWIIEVGIEQRQRCSRVETTQVQPLSGEVHRQRLCFRVLQQPADLLLEHHGILQTPLRRDAQQLRVRRRAPQEERQTRRQIDIADAIRLTGATRHRLFFNAVDEL